MRIAAIELNIIRGLLRNQSLESYVIRKSVKRSLEGGDWKSTCTSNSLVAYPTARPVLRGEGSGNAPDLPDRPLVLDTRLNLTKAYSARVRGFDN